MKLKIIITLILSMNCYSFAQNGWIWQNPLPQGNDMSNLQFVNSTTAYALCFNSVMKSTNAGNNWSIYYTGHSQNNTSLHFINETTGFVVSDSGTVLKTVNGGVNWSVISNMHQKKFHKTYFLNSDTGYLIRHNDLYGTRGTGLYRTSNGGVSWNVLLEDTTISIYDIKFADMQTGYFGGHLSYYSNNYNYFKIFKTTNGGLNIDSIYTGFIFPVKGIEIRNNIIFIYGGRSLPSVCGLHYSINGGLSWLQSDLHISLKDVSYLNANNFYATEVLNGSSVLLYKSTNNGINWNSVAGDMKNYDFEFVNTSTGVSVGRMGQIYKTTNSGLNWNSMTSSIYNDYFSSVEFVNSTTGFAGGGNTLLKTSNGGNNWFLLPRIPGEQIEFTDVNTGYAVNYDTLYKTTNCGLTWVNLNYGLMGQVNGMSFLNNNTGFILASPLKKTTNGGLSWTSINSYIGYPQCIYFYNESMGFIGEDVYNLGWGIRRTTNGGQNWDFQTLPTVDDYIYDFYFTNSSTGFFTTTGKIFKTTNSGDNWYQIYEYTDSFGFWSALWSIKFLNENVGYATASEGEVLRTTDAGITWKKFQSIANYGFYNMYFIDVNTGYFVSGGLILKTTNGCGDPIGIEPISSSIPNSFELFQNYPNPFNPVTTIRFTIPNSASRRNELTTLKIFDILGKELSVPVNEILSPGEYEILWDASEFPSGVYFCKLSSGSRSTSLKIMLVK